MACNIEEVVLQALRSRAPAAFRVDATCDSREVCDEAIAASEGGGLILCSRSGAIEEMERVLRVHQHRKGSVIVALAPARGGHVSDFFADAAVMDSMTPPPAWFLDAVGAEGNLCAIGGCWLYCVGVN